MQIVAWKSEDGMLFEDKKLYTNHVRKLTREKNAAEQARLIKIKTSEWYEDNLWHAVKSIDQLFHALKLHSAVFGKAVIDDTSNWLTTSKRKIMPIPTIEKIVCGNIRYSPLVSNTHSSPIGKPQNFMCKDDLPKGYPGFAGRITYNVSWDDRFAYEYAGSSDFWRPTRVNMCSGGYHGDDVSDSGVYLQVFCYEFRIYTDDWPGLKSSVEEAQAHIDELTVLDQLNGATTKKPTIMEIINERYPASSYQPIQRNK